jgi:hypothetical protein
MIDRTRLIALALATALTPVAATAQVARPTQNLAAPVKNSAACRTTRDR